MMIVYIPKSASNDSVINQDKFIFWSMVPLYVIWQSI